MRFFKSIEFNCPCCQKAIMDTRFLNMINQARDLANIPFNITSGYRCKNYNNVIGGVNESAHISGLAADISCENSSNRLIIIEALLDTGFKRIGIANNFIHMDCDDSKKDSIWLY